MKHFFSALLLFCYSYVSAQEHVRFRASVDAAIGFGENIDATTQTVGNRMATVTLSVAKKGLSLGAGTGLYKMKGTKSHDHYIPIYGELAYLVQRDKVAPFFGLKIGKLTPNKDDGTLFPALNKATMMYNPSIGLAIDLKVIYLMPFLQYLVPADFDSRFDTFGVGLRVLTH